VYDTLHGMHTQSAPNRIAELVRERGTRLVHVAAHCDVDQSTAWRWQQGLSPIPDEQKGRLAEFFGVTRAYLMGWDEDRTDDPTAPAAA
jgi:transcriptional regulator with XRE-family HTH domain